MSQNKKRNGIIHSSLCVATSATRGLPPAPRSRCLRACAERPVLSIASLPGDCAGTQTRHGRSTSTWLSHLIDDYGPLVRIVGDLVALLHAPATSEVRGSCGGAAQTARTARRRAVGVQARPCAELGTAGRGTDAMISAVITAVPSSFLSVSRELA